MNLICTWRFYRRMGRKRDIAKKLSESQDDKVGIRKEHNEIYKITNWYFVDVEFKWNNYNRKMRWHL